MCRSRNTLAPAAQARGGITIGTIDSPILGAGLYVDGAVGAAGSTGRGEANLYNLCSFAIVENMRRGMHPKDAGLDALRRIQSNTVEKRLLNRRGLATGWRKVGPQPQAAVRAPGFLT